MNRELLEKPFTAAQIRQRKGRNGLLDYVEGHTVIQRLNDALESQWSFEVMHHEIREEEVLVLGKLTAETIAKMAFGTSQVTRERESGKAVSLGDDLKAAATDAMKKCATFLGVGLHLYAEKPIGGRVPVPRGGGPVAPPRPAPAAPVGPSPTGRGPVNGSSPVRAPSRPPVAAAGNSPAADVAPAARPSTAGAVPRAAPATARQLDAIHKVARAKGLDEQAVEHMSLRVFNRKLDGLIQAEAAQLLKELSNLKRRVA